MSRSSLRVLATQRGWIALVALSLGVALSTTVVSAAEKKTGANYKPEQVASDYGIPQVALINKYIAAGWKDYEFSPSKTATEGEWCRRVYLDIIGRIPSVKELDAFLKNDSPRKKLELVNTLLGDDFIEDYARNWTTIWTNILIGRTGGTERRSLTSRPGMQQYLRRALQRNKPYDQMVYELVTASGTTTPGTEGFNGATNFLVMKYEEKAAQATAKTSQIFMGLQVQCTQCHNHPFNDWKQNQFWEMNAFFRQSKPLRRFDGREIANVELIDESWAGEGTPAEPEQAELYYELRNGITKVAYPVFVDGTSLLDLKPDVGNSGYLEDVNRRQELGKMMLKSRYLDKMVANRYWSHFLGYGFTKPIDDLGPHNPPTHPELLDELGMEVRKHSFNIKDLIRWITLSEAYSLSSRLNSTNVSDDPSLGEKPMFSHFYLRQMQAEELYESLLTATRADQTQGEKAEEVKRRWLGQFGMAFGTDEGDESTTFNGTIPQALMLMNGDLVSKATTLESGSFLSLIAKSSISNRDKIRYLYKASLARKPTNSELQVANALLAARKGKVAEALQDIWWVLLNSNEFIINH